jgi:hypothetical protein
MTNIQIPPATGRQLSRRSLLRSAGSVAAVGVAVGTVGAGRWIFGTSAAAATIDAGAARAAAGIKPVAGNTGVVAGSVLTQYNGDMVVTTAGAVIQNLDIRGNVNVKASNVTIRNCIIRGAAVAPTSGSYALIMQYSNNVTKLVVEDCTLVAQSPNPWTSGIQGTNMTIRRCDISNTVDGIDSMGVGNVLVDCCYIHDGSYFTPSTTHTDNQTHDDGIQITNGTNVVFTNNNITNFFMSCFMVGQDQGPIVGLRIVNNWLDGGTATINLAAKSYGTLKAVVTGNRFGRSRTNSYQILTTGAVDKTTITGNVWDDNGQPVRIVSN